MKFFGFRVLWLFVLFGCEDLPFKDSDLENKPPAITKTADSGESAPETEPEQNPAPTIKDESRTCADCPAPQNADKPAIETAPPISDETTERIPENNPPEGEIPEQSIPEKETVIISGNLKLKEDLVIQDRKVVLNMARIKIYEHDLFILAEEFVSIHSIIQNFPEGKRGKNKQDGKSGGNILIEAETATGELQLVLNGQSGGRVPRRRSLSKEERKRLKGSQGLNGYNAVYQTFCRDIKLKVPILVPFPLGSLSIPVDRDCWEECAAFPTPGDDGGKGRPGLSGWDGKNGGNSGSFHLKAVELSDFHLTDIQNSPGLASKGSKGSKGGSGGRSGWNGADEKDLCEDDLPRPRKGRRGEEGPKGKDGRNGEKGTVCLERIFQDEESPDSNNKEQERTICY